MKIRYVFVAIVLATAVAACSSSPTSPEPARSSENLPVLRDNIPADSTANRGGGWAGSGG
ncbi:MAG TPA: hypothetical protein VF746_02910 [Longimicrobium sp.]|jgi:hypothetical protein